MWIKGLARRRWVAERVGSRRRSQNRRQPLRHRGLRIEQFEERTLLSVAPLNTNDVLINQSTVSAECACRQVGGHRQQRRLRGRLAPERCGGRLQHLRPLLYRRRSADRSAHGRRPFRSTVQRQRDSGTHGEQHDHALPGPGEHHDPGRPGHTARRCRDVRFGRPDHRF